MGLIIAVAIAGLVWMALWRSRRLASASLQLVGAALLAGLAGYALQGRVGLTGSPASERRTTALPPAMPMELAADFYERFNASTPWLVIANAYMSRGDSEGAIDVLQAALRAQPRQSQLWIALGNAMAIHNGGRMSPAVDLAFRQAELSAPGRPGPRFFAGLLLLQTGQVDQALVVWNELLATAPKTAAWRSGLAAKIAAVEAVRDGTDARADLTKATPTAR